MFIVKRGRNEISRRSVDSSVTIPHELTYRNLETNRPAATSDAVTAFNFCGCGWPQNMLIPKGSPEGLPCQLFVMVSNGANDQVYNTNTIQLFKGHHFQLFIKMNKNNLPPNLQNKSLR